MNDFELYNFIADANFDQFIDQIRGENEDQVANFGCADDLINGCFVHNNDNNNNNLSVGPTNNLNSNVSSNVFGFEDTTNNNTMVSSNPETLLGSAILLPDLDGEITMVGDDDEENDGEDSSGTTTTTATKSKSGKVDRSRTLISERRRRGRMKEKLYALRSLVPNITKMDKASIVGDAVLYVQDLQAQAKKLKAEIESLEASLEEAETYPQSLNHHHQINNNNNTSNPISSSSLVPNNAIIQMDMFQVEERGFYVKVVCYNGEGTAVSLYKALESLTNFNIHTSNLATVSNTFVLTFTLNVKECDHQEQINLPNLKLWVTGAFLNQGFQLS